MPCSRFVPLACSVLALTIAGALAAPPAQAASELFVQSAGSATVVRQQGALYTLTLRDTPATLRFDDRPARRSTRIAVDRFVALWRGDFGRDAPNAALVGTRAGRSSETVLELRSARRIRGGLRFTVRAHGGPPPRKLRDVSLFVDPIGFPTLPIRPGAADLVLTPGIPYIVGSPNVPTTTVFGNVTFEPGSSLQFSGGMLALTVGDPGQVAALAAASTPPPTSAVAGHLVWQFADSTLIQIQPTARLSLDDVFLYAGPTSPFRLPTGPTPGSSS